MNEIRFPYKPKIYILLPGIIVLIGCALWFGNAAMTNENELVITFFNQSLIKLSNEMASIFYLLVSIFFIMFAMYTIKALYLGVTVTKEIVITEREIIAPKNGISKTIISVKFNEIKDINIKSIQQQQFLYILYQGGKLTIPQSMLPNRQAFEELISLVSARVNG